MTQPYTMKELPLTERPYEKCMHYGAKSLSDTELMAVLLRTGVKGENALDLAKRILFQNPTGTEGILAIHHLSVEALKEMNGIGTVKAIQIVCLSELAKRLAKESAQTSLNFQSPESIARYYMEDLRHENQEILKLLMLNAKSALIGEKNISKGTVNATLITPRELFIEALQKNAVAIVVLHNHPSGDPTPSKEDIKTTDRIQEAGKIIGIELLDHIIIGNNCYISFHEEGLL